ncbi:methionyl-tRNA formyltransferase [Candidatus Saccharibacteria bacterium CG11_big_fil_rev_8_21_14_0_20_41_19]|nr:MAG: methionyl-tRNA formyltransferase [Candidatus Saccharibacteria bacterium CG2_30_41_52]PIQ70832.1 MAG: methionyl-tRNA formyltransferase [Candidatus Saccharibacteria bacterium CG11_big_fil_rev_8_21_14_0_20_41_19]PIZ60729.1 MAG: methionyl-tRNA formyltransferase [Candidatus Saccharibacteria bacterium CG_4_10_14_0_2_um_filter_41_11]PJC29583.1 MAG: methionyl-tRNA formyltransferase [Candidatus Saccharibacteria bacterium CG_4_9_14_0_2_um_filter_41_9]PJE65756.1 MAG: methionyl-tRNA formyltransfera
MNNTSTTIVFFGTDDFSLAALKALFESGYNIAAIITKPDSKSGRGHTLTMPSVKKFALEKNLEVWQPLKVTEINGKIQALGNNIAGVLASYGKIIPQSTIDLFTPGIINIHPSLLPLYRGSSPIESAIKNGDKQTGVTIMQLEAGMDSGPIYGHKVHQLSGTETRLELYKTLAHIGAATLINLLPSILDGSLIPSNQDNDKAVYCSLLTKQDAILIPNEITAQTAERLVRAHLAFPRTKIEVMGHTIIITKAHVTSEQKTALDILCQDGNYLSIDQLIAPSGKTMSSNDFINGHA